MQRETDKDTLLMHSKYLKQRVYWKNILSIDEGHTDFCAVLSSTKKGRSQKAEQKQLKIPFHDELSQRVLKLAKNSDLSVFILLVSALKALIFRYTFIGDISVLAPIHRLKVTKETLNHQVLLRNQVEWDLTFKELLLKVRQTVLDAYENQDYPYEKLLQHLFAGTGDEDKKIISNIRCSFKGLHHDWANDSPSPLFSFNFRREGEQLSGEFSYHDGTLEESEILPFLNHLVLLLAHALQNMELKISALSFLSHEEKKRLLEEFNTNRADFPRYKTICHFVEEHAAKTPDAPALIFMEEKISYADLNAHTTQLAGRLRQMGIGEDQTVAILMERSPLMAVSIIAIWKAGGAYIPLGVDHPLQRIHEILTDSGTRLLIAASPYLSPDLETSWDGTIKTMDKLDTLETPGPLTIPEPSENKALLPDLEINMNSLAYVIYTSGSTGKPKGAMVEHIGMMNHIHAKIADLLLSDKSIVAQNASCTFDISVWQFFAALTSGGTTAICHDDEILEPQQFITRLIRHRITVLEVVPSYLSVLLESLDTPPQPLDFLQFLLVTGETLKMGLVEKWFAFYPGIPMVNAYGPTEASDDITHFIMSCAPQKEQIPIGKPIQNLNIYIVDPFANLCPIGVKGEIWVSGVGVGRGYLKDEHRTKLAFREDPFTPANTIRLYRTGDLGCWLPDGNIEFFGRLDNQVKIRGFRIELGEIESQLCTHPNIKEAVVLVRESTEKYLCAFLVPIIKGKLDVRELKEYLKGTLPYYMIPENIFELDHMPLTPNGKIDRKALFLLDTGRTTEIGKTYVPPRNEMEEKLVDIWSEILGKPKDTIGINANFFEIGGHSLRATVVISKIQRIFNIKITLAELFRNPTIEEISILIRQAKEDIFLPVPSAEQMEYYPLSSVQQGLFFLQEMDKESTVYNMPMVIAFGEDIAIKKLEQVFVTLLQRHETLRTSFLILEDQPVQKIHHHVDFKIKRITLEEVEVLSSEPPPVTRAVSEFIHSFDLSQAPLLRAGLIKISNIKYLLVVDIHHIVSDGISLQLLKKEFFALYNDEALPALKIQYKDYVMWRNSPSQQQTIKAQESYWLTTLSGEIPLLNLPLDYPRPFIQSFEGKRLFFSIPKKETSALNTLAQKTGMTLYMVLLSAFNILLHKLSGQEDIIIGIPVAGRNHSDLENIIGMLVNTMAVRYYPRRESLLQHFLKDVAVNTLNSFENQAYSFNELVEHVVIKREPGRNPLFDVMIDLQNMEDGESNGIGTEDILRESDSYMGESRVSRFDMTWDGEFRANQLFFGIEYCTKLFKEETIRKFIQYFKTIIAAVSETEGMNLKIGALEILSEAEKKQILIDFNGTTIAYPENITISGLFEAAAASNPGKIALEFNDEQLTYEALNIKIHRLAVILQRKGVTSDTLVAIFVNRSLQMIIAVMAVLKAGGAYVPLDPSYPRDRLEYMLADSCSPFLLTQKEIKLPFTFTGEITYMDEEAPDNRIADMPVPLEVFSKPHNVTYIIYTSGSTGRPKGVMVQNNNYVNSYFGWRTAYHLDEIEVNLLQMAAFSFDVFCGDLARALLSGGKMVICPEDVRLDPPVLHQLLVSRRISLFEATPSLVLPFMDYIYEHQLKLKHLVLLIIGSDSCPQEAYMKLVSRFGSQMRVLNSYGVTEATIDTSFYESSMQHLSMSGNVPIGKPLPNMSCYILDPTNNPQPIGIAGELFIGGKGVARGYINQCQLTHQRFVPHPFQAGQQVYKTGDLAQWLPDGNIEFLGRIDNQVKIRGFRIELGEIESQILKYQDITEAIVVDKPMGKGNSNEDRVLCAYLVSPRELTEFLPGLRAFLSAALPYYMVPTFFVRLHTIPLTPNGKVDRKGLPAPEIKTGNGYTAPSNRIEEQLVVIWTKILGIEKEKIGIADNFFELGGHSLRATTMAALIHKEFNVKVPLAEIFKSPDIRGLSEYIKKQRVDLFSAIEPAEEKEYYPLSSPQKRLYILYQSAPESVVYNLPQLFIIESPITLKKAHTLFEQLIQRHESLRTSFEMIDYQPVQRIYSHVPFEIQDYDIADFMRTNPGTVAAIKVDELIAQFVRPFNLSQPPLFRVGMIKIKEGHHVLMVDMHHIVSDGTSHGILANEFLALYAGKELPPLALQYKDYSQWQSSHRTQQMLKQQENYWLQQFKGEIPTLNIPADFNRPDIQNFEGDSIVFQLGQQEVEGIKQIIKEENVTFYIVLLTIYYILLYKLTGREDIVVGSGTAGRNHADLQNIIGMFINMIALRNHPTPTKSFREFLLEVKEKALTAYENQDYPFDMLVEKVAPSADRSRNPMFNVAFSSQNTEVASPLSTIPDISTSELIVKPYGHTNMVSRFDMTIFASDSPEGALLRIEYKTSLFKKDTIHRFINYFKEIASIVVENRNILFKDITISHHLLTAKPIRFEMEVDF